MNQKALKSIQSQLHSFLQPIKLVVVTKHVDSKTIHRLIELDVKAIGENRTEVAAEKFAHISPSSKLEKHFIGQIQSKKINQIVELFDFIHSVASNRHLLKIDHVAQQINKPVQVFLQFNISQEPQKAGYDIKDLGLIKQALRQIQHISVVGLMGMASNSVNKEDIRTQFKVLRNLRDELQKDFPSIQELSMGMSNDYLIAIEEGATVLRIGRGILGAE